MVSGGVVGKKGDDAEERGGEEGGEAGGCADEKRGEPAEIAYGNAEEVSLAGRAGGLVWIGMGSWWASADRISLMAESVGNGLVRAVDVARDVTERKAPNGVAFGVFGEPPFRMRSWRG